MRLVAGRHRGRLLVAPPGRIARPTADRVRQALFDVLAHTDLVELEGAVVVDAFAGSGALGLEALSRGAAACTFLDSATAALECTRRNAATLREEARASMIRADALKPPPAREPATLAFLDPPYGRDLPGPALTALAAHGWFCPGAVIVVETSAQDVLPPLPFCELLDERRYRLTVVRFLRLT